MSTLREVVEEVIKDWDHSEFESSDEEGRPTCGHPSHGGWRVYAPCSDTQHARQLRDRIAGTIR